MANVISMSDFRKTAVELGETVVVSEEEKTHRDQVDRAHDIVIEALKGAMKQIRDEKLDPVDMAFACAGDGISGLLHFGWTLDEVDEWMRGVFGEREDEDSEEDHDQ